MKYLVLLFLFLGGCTSAYKAGCIDGILDEQELNTFIREDDTQDFKDFMRKQADRRCSELERKDLKRQRVENSTYRRSPY